MKKACQDSQCNRPGELRNLSDFPRNQQSPDGRYLYCKECCRRRSRALRATRGAREYRRKELGIVRKPMAMARNGNALSLVYDAIRSGARTREAIHGATELDYDLIGDALCELIWEAGAVKIRNREFLSIDDIHLAA